MLKRICSFVSGMMIICLVVIAIILYLPFFKGGKSLAVLSGSMEPELPVGSLVSTEEIPFDKLEKGDVITYQLMDRVMVTHRVSEIDYVTREIVTKGDANNAVDAAVVTEQQIVGKVDYHIPYLGYISIYIKTPLGIMIVCGILVVLILLNFLPEIFRADTKHTKKETDSAGMTIV